MALTSSQIELHLDGPGQCQQPGRWSQSHAVAVPGPSQGSSAFKSESAGDLSQEERTSAWLVLPLLRGCPKYPTHDSASHLTAEAEISDGRQVGVHAA